MNWRITAATAALLILPLGTTYAAVTNQDSNSQESFRSSATTEIAQRAKRGKKGRRGDRINKVLKQLDLTTEQSEQIKAIKESAQASKENLREQMRAEKQEMRSLFESDASSAELTQQHQKLQALHQQRGENRFQTMLQIREILTSEQRAKMAELISQRSERRGHRGQ